MAADFEGNASIEYVEEEEKEGMKWSRKLRRKTREKMTSGLKTERG